MGTDRLPASDFGLPSARSTSDLGYRCGLDLAHTRRAGGYRVTRFRGEQLRGRDQGERTEALWTWPQDRVKQVVPYSISRSLAVHTLPSTTQGVAVNYRIITGAATGRLRFGTAMYRIFISHASAEFGEAKARKDRLAQQGPPPANGSLLDADMVRPGPHWTDEQNQAIKNSDAVVCATSNRWVGGPERMAGFRTAGYRVLCARPESSPAGEMGMAWQRADLFGNAEPAETSLDDDGSLRNPSGTSGHPPQSKTRSRTRART